MNQYILTPIEHKDVIIPASISSKVLTVGLEHKHHRGGIGGVIDTYSKYFQVFNFVSTYKPQKFKVAIIPYFILSCTKLILKLIYNNNIKIIHIHGAARGSIYRKFIVFLISKYLFHCKVIYHSHGSEFEVFYKESNFYTRKLIKFFMENVSLIICLSNQWDSFFRKEFKAKKIVILENIVEKAPIVSALKSLKPLKLLFLGAIGKRKGIFDLLDVLNSNKEDLHGKLKLIVGGNGEVEKLHSYVKENGLEDLVQFEGWVTGDRKKQLLNESHVYILPSYNEGLPLSILEAMSHSLAIISTSVGGTPEVVKDGLNGYLIQPGDKQGILKAIHKFIEFPNLINTMGSASITLVEPYYSTSVIPKLNTIYKSLIN